MTASNPPSDDLLRGLAQLGLRAGADVPHAFLVHAHKSRLGPTQTLEQFVALERRAREATNLARRTRAACLGSYKLMDRFDWAHPRKIDRPLIEQILSLGFVSFKPWGTVFPGAACVGALIERFAQHCHRIDIDADSWRGSHGFERDHEPASPSRSSKSR